MKFHQLLAIFLVSLFLDVEYKASIVIRPLDIFLLLTLTGQILGFKRFKIATNPATVALYIFLIFIVLNGLAKVSLSTVVKEGVQLVEFLFLMHLIADVTSDTQQRKEFINIIFWGVGLVALFSVIYHVSKGIYSGYKELDSPKHAFAYFALLALFKYFNSTKKNRIFYFFVLLCALSMSLLSGERKGWAGLIVGAGFFLLLQVKSSLSKRNISKIMSLGGVVAVSGVIVFIMLIYDADFKYLARQLTSVTDIENYFASNAGNGESSYDSQSDYERAVMFQYGIALFLKNPIFGIGVDQFIIYISTVTQGKITHDAHNFYLKILDEEGIVGFALFLIFNFLLFIVLLKKTKSKIPDVSFTARCLIAMFLLGSVVNFFLASKALSWMYFLLPCGMLIGLNKGSIQRQNVSEFSITGPNSRVPEVTI